MKFKLMLITSIIFLIGMNVFSQTYDTNDVNILRNIDFNCDRTNQLNWYEEIDPGKWEDVNWDLSDPRRILNIYIADKSITGNLNLTGLTNMNYFNCNVNQLTSLDASGLINLKKLYCDNNQLISLNISGLTNLENFQCLDNLLTTLNASGLTNLKVMDCSLNNLTALNVSGSTNLQELVCINNSLTSLDVSGLTNLQIFSCSGNKLIALDASGLTNLQKLSCYDNSLTTLNVSGLTNLKELCCINNFLTFLDVSGLTNLLGLQCSNNLITGLNLSGLINLQALDCSNNQLGVLDVSGCTNLLYLYCDYNELTSMEVTGLTNLTFFSCTHNKLPFSSLATGLFIAGDGFEYSPQNDLYESRTITADTTLDYSAEKLINSTPTTFIFIKNSKTYDTISTGIFNTIGAGYYWCEMTNELFPGFSLYTSQIIVIPVVNISPVFIGMNGTDSLATFTITSNTPWEITCPEDWLVFNTMSGDTDDTIQIETSQNTDDTARMAVITIQASQYPEISATVTLIQGPGTTTHISVSDTLFTISGSSSETVSLDILSNTGWRLTGMPSWLTGSPAFGVNNGTIELTVPANPIPAKRTAVLALSGIGIDTLITIMVIQLPGKALSVPDNSQEAFVVYPNPSSGTIYVKGISGAVPSTINIYSMEGKKLQCVRTDSVIKEIDLDSYPAGVYILEIRSQDQIVTKKIIKK